MLAHIWEFLEASTAYLLSFLLLAVIARSIYDKCIQYKHRLLTNWPVPLFFFEMLREPLRHIPPKNSTGRTVRAPHP